MILEVVEYATRVIHVANEVRKVSLGEMGGSNCLAGNESRCCSTLTATFLRQKGRYIVTIVGAQSQTIQDIYSVHLLSINI